MAEVVPCFACALGAFAEGSPLLVVKGSRPEVFGFVAGKCAPVGDQVRHGGQVDGGGGVSGVVGFVYFWWAECSEAAVYGVDVVAPFVCPG